MVSVERRIGQYAADGDESESVRASSPQYMYTVALTTILLSLGGNMFTRAAFRLGYNRNNRRVVVYHSVRARHGRSFDFAALEPVREGYPKLLLSYVVDHPQTVNNAFVRCFLRL